MKLERLIERLLVLKDNVDPDTEVLLFNQALKASC